MQHQHEQLLSVIQTSRDAEHKESQKVRHEETHATDETEETAGYPQDEEETSESTLPPVIKSLVDFMKG
jgi:hypothetical protein